MKKIIPVFLMVIIALLAFQKAYSQTTEASNKFHVKVIQNRLAFTTIADYEKVVNQPSDDLKKSFLKTVNTLQGFISFGDKQNPSLTLKKNKDSLKYLINDRYFTSILNPDLSVQMGDYILRVNPTTEKVYVLPAANADQYKDLIAENIKNKLIQVFSTGEDVLEILKGKKRRLSFCNESGIGGKHNGMYLNDNSGILATLEFHRYGFYYSLFALLSPMNSSGNTYTFNFTGGLNTGLVYYHVKCGGTVGPYQVTTNGTWLLSTRRYQSYQGSTNLNELYFGCKITKLVNGVTTDITPYFNVRMNY